jgi:hypothetical protein
MRVQPLELILCFFWRRDRTSDATIACKTRLSYLVSWICECKTISLRTRLRAKAPLQRKARRVKRGLEFDVVVEVFGDAAEDLIFRWGYHHLAVLKKTVEPTWHKSGMKKLSDLVPTAENALKPAAKEVLRIEWISGRS